MNEIANIKSSGAVLNNLPYIPKVIILSLIIYFSVIIIGTALNYLEKAEIKLLGSMVGTKASNAIIQRLTFIGTITHECAHAVIALITGCKIVEFKPLILFNKNNNGELGHVKVAFKPGAIGNAKMSLVSCAPVFVNLALAWLAYTKMFIGGSMMIKIIAVYLMISFINHASMSPVDTKNYLRGAVVILIIIAIVVGIVAL